MAVESSDSEDFLLRSGPRSGLKREFAFALKAQANFSGMFARTRSGKIRYSPLVRASSSPLHKKIKRSVIKDVENDSPKSEDAVVEIPVELLSCELRSSHNNISDSDVEFKDSVKMNDEVKESFEGEGNNSKFVSITNRRDENLKLNFKEEKSADVDSFAVESIREDGTLETDNEMEKSQDADFCDINVVEQKRAVKIGDETEGSLSVENPLYESINKDEINIDYKEIENSPRENLDVDAPFGIVDMDETKNTVKEIVKSSAKENSDIQLPSNNDNLEINIDLPGTTLSCVDSPIVIDDATEDISWSTSKSKLVRRFTRSLLKTNVEQLDLARPKEERNTSSGEGASKVVIENGIQIIHETSASSPSAIELGLKVLKKITITKFPSNVRELLATNLLEGLPVTYVWNRGILQGTIKEGGILCSCSSCNGHTVISPLHFELHAGSTNKNAPKYIYLDNGMTLREVLMASKSVPLDAVETTIQDAISSPIVKRISVCPFCKESFQALEIGIHPSICYKCMQFRKIQGRRHHETDSVARTFGESRKMLANQNREIITAVRQKKPKKSDKSRKPQKPEEKLQTPKKQKKIEKSLEAGSSNSLLRKKLHGKLTTRDMRLHKLVFMEDGLPEGTEVAYYLRGQRLLEGYKKGDGIFCRCCNSVVSASQFEAHAGWASRRKPYLNIFTSNGVSLHELSISLSKGRKFSNNENDDLCTICADGGDLLCCDGCPRAFHTECLDLAVVPRGDWYCKYCLNLFQQEKGAERNANALAAGRVLGVDPIEQISDRCIRIVKTQETVGGCVLCRSHDFSKLKFGPRTVMLCDQCEREFHVGCLKNHKMADLQKLPEGTWFCCDECTGIHTYLQKMILSEPAKLQGSLLDIIKQKQEEKGLTTGADFDIRWRLLSGKFSSDSRLLLSKAVALFHESFDPIVDQMTGRDLIPSMVYGRNLRDQEFTGMYCAVLTVNSSVVSAGLLRIFGQQAAELPLVATRNENQGQGYFQSLFSCIERLLSMLNVKHLVLPAAEEAESIWIKKFGFKKIKQEELYRITKGSHMMVFEGTSVLQKPLPRYEDVDH